MYKAFLFSFFLLNCVLVVCPQFSALLKGFGKLFTKSVSKVPLKTASRNITRTSLGLEVRIPSSTKLVKVKNPYRIRIAGKRRYLDESTFRLITPAPILHTPLFVWNVLSSHLNNVDKVVVDETTEAVSNFHWATYQTAVYSVREAFDNTQQYTNKDLAWYKTNYMKLERVTDDMNDSALQECLVKFFSPFMWMKLQERLSRQVLLRLCRDNVEPTGADIIMNMAIQLDRLKPWQTQYRGNITIINGQDKMVWYSGDKNSKMINLINKVTPLEMYQETIKIFTPEFKQSLLMSAAIRYNQTYNEIFFDKCENCDHISSSLSGNSSKLEDIETNKFH